MSVRIHVGDARERLAELPDESVHMVLTSPPYWKLRDYGLTEGGIGHEPTIQDHITALLEVFREIWRVLRADGTCWLNYGDAYAGGGRGFCASECKQRTNIGSLMEPNTVPDGLKAKDLMFLPARLALALQADGWWVRSEIIWFKRNAFPESVKDRPVNAHEKIYLLAKSGRPKFWVNRFKGVGSRVRPRRNEFRYFDRDTGEPVSEAHPRARRVSVWQGFDYFYDAGAVRTALAPDSRARLQRARAVGYMPPGQVEHRGVAGARPRGIDKKPRGHKRRHQGLVGEWDARSYDEQRANGASLRNVWDIPIHGYKGAHFATFPTRLAELCIAAGTSEKGCCPECGAPWVRFRAPDVGGVLGRSWHDHSDDAGIGNSMREPGWDKGYHRGQTVRWHTTCECAPYPWTPPAPCTVLDPFGGAGTTALVAERMGRDAILVEMNAEYAEMARARIAEDAPPMFPVEVGIEQADVDHHQ